MTPAIFMRCVRRPDTNVYSTLANMACAQPDAIAASGKIHLISGDNDTAFLSTLMRMQSVVVHHQPVDSMRAWKPKRREAWSYSFMMREAVKLGGDCIVMEDDMTFSNNWLSRMLTTVDTIRLEHDKFMLSAYHRLSLQSANGYEVLPKYYANVHSTHFWGNLCTFWCKELIAGFIPYLDSIISSQDDLSSDLSVREYCDRANAPFFVTVPSLVQHMGDKTTLRNDGVRRSPMFESFYTGSKQ